MFSPSPIFASGIWYVANSSCLPSMRLIPENQSNEVRNIARCTWLSFVTPRDRDEGPRKWRVGGIWGHGSVNMHVSAEESEHQKPTVQIKFPKLGWKWCSRILSCPFPDRHCVSHLSKNPKYPLDDEIERESSIAVSTAECRTKTY